ncbi:antitoxin Xre/MbcA/ParS toxin-binding domain-containing protein [Gemmatimonas sp.]|uniref:antitoxin Xre/MbcA/ParS toxin-binding domain-containing protein n=1 Tax=Gemmatimonas sp. TaxID=1962908 RepID=UPI00333FF976
MTTATDHELNLEALSKRGEKLGLELQELAGILGVDQSTFYRWRHGQAAPRALAMSRIEQTQELFELLRRLFAGPDLARTWLRTAKPASLGGAATPIDVMLQGRIDRVLAVLHTLASGG